jgi:hypothetical protein
MIGDDQEYRVTQQAAARLARDLAQVYEQSAADPALWSVVRSGLFAQLADLEDQLAEYDARSLKRAARQESAPT